MTAKKRDQLHHDLVQQYLPGLILNTIPGIIHEFGDPYVARPDPGGMAAYPPMTMGIVCVMLEAERTTYRKMVGIPRNNHAMATRMGLKKIPSKSTIARSYGLIPEWYRVHVHQTVIRDVEAGSLAGCGSDEVWPFASLMNKCTGADMPSVAGTSKIILGHFSRFGLPAAISPDCPWSCCHLACPVDVYLLRYLWRQVVQAHYLPDVRDVKSRVGLRSYVLLQTHGCDTATYYVCNYTIHDVSRNSFGQSASGKIPEAFEASFVVTT